MPPSAARVLEPGEPPKTTKWISFAADLASQLLIDPRRIFLSGFSNGGEMCSRIAVEASDLFAAVGCSAGGLEAVHPTTAGHPNIPEVLSLGNIDSHALDRIQAVDPSYTEIPLDPDELLATPIISTGIADAIASLNLRDHPFGAVEKPTFTVVQWRKAAVGNDDGGKVEAKPAKDEFRVIR